MGRLGYFSAFFLLSSGCWAQEAPGTPGWVVLPIEEYQALRGKAFPTEPASAPPPVNATISRIDYDLHVDNGVATGHAKLAIDVLMDGWVRVPIPQGLLVRAARLGGRSVTLAADAKQRTLSAVLSQKGRAELDLDVVFTVASAGGEQRLSLPAGDSGVTRALIAAAGPDVEVQATGGFLAERTAAQWVAYGRGAEPLVLIWRKRVDEPKTELPLRMRGTLVQLFGLGEDASSVNAEVSIDVIQGAAHQVRIAVPDSVTINQVPGATVADWDIQNGELIVNFLEPVENAVQFAIAGEIRLPREGAIAVPMLKLLGAERDSGGVAVEVLGAGEIIDATPAGLDPVDAAELGGAAASRQSPSMAAYRYRAGAAANSLSLQVARYTQQAVLTANVEEARYRALLTPDGKTLVQARYAVRNNQRNFVRITLPAGAEVWSSLLEGKPVRPGEDAGSLLFPLAKERAGQEAALFALEVVYLARGAAWDGNGSVSLALPVLDLPVSRSAVVVYHSPEFRVESQIGAFRETEYEAPTSEVLAGQVAVAPADTRLVNANASAAQTLADRYRGRPQNRTGRRAPPIEVAFPALGPTLFLVAELTGEGAVPAIDLSYKKGGSR